MVMFDCYECDGKGSCKINDRIVEVKCYVCKGTGKLDWIDNIIQSKGVVIWGQKTLKPRKNNDRI